MAEPGKKFDTGKAPVAQGFFAYFPRAIKAIAMVSKYGKEKYNLSYQDVNWARVDNGNWRYADGKARHEIDQYIDDGGYDPESKLHHLAMEAWNACATLELFLRNGGSLYKPDEKKDENGNPQPR